MIQTAQELYNYGSSFIHKRKYNSLSIKLGKKKNERGLLTEIVLVEEKELMI